MAVDTNCFKLKQVMTEKLEKLQDYLSSNQLPLSVLVYGFKEAVTEHRRRAVAQAFVDHAVARPRRWKEVSANDLQLIASAAFGDVVRVTHILRTTKPHLGLFQYLAITQAAKRRHEEVVRLLVDALTPDMVREVLRVATTDCTLTHLVPVLLAACTDLDPAGRDNQLLVSAIRANCEDTFHELLRDPRINPTETTEPVLHLDLALMEAATRGRAPLVHTLLTATPVNPAAQGNRALVLACSSPGNVKVVEQLVCLGRVDPSKPNNEPLCTAVRVNAPDTVDFFLTRVPDRVDPAANDNECIIHAAEFNLIHILHSLLRDPRVKPAARENEAIQRASQNGNLQVLQALLPLAGVTPKANKSAALRRAAGRGHVTVVQALLADDRANPSAEKNEAIRKAAAYGCVAVVKALLEDGRADPAAEKNEAIRKAAAYGHAAVVRALLENGRADPAAEKNEAIRKAAAYGCVAVVEALLENGRADPAAEKNEAIRQASIAGHAAVVRALLENGRADPAAEKNEAIRKAAAYGCVEVVKALLENGRADPAAEKNEAIRQASIAGHAAVVRALLKNGRADPAAEKNEAIRKAAAYGCVAVVEALLKNGRANPTAENNEAIIQAVRAGHIVLLSVLLKDGRANPAARDNEPITIAVRRGSLYMVQALLSDGRVDPAVNDNVLICDAAQRGFLGIVQLLLARPDVDPTVHDLDVLRLASDREPSLMDLLLRDARVRSSPVFDAAVDTLIRRETNPDILHAIAKACPEKTLNAVRAPTMARVSAAQAADMFPKVTSPEKMAEIVATSPRLPSPMLALLGAALPDGDVPPAVLAARQGQRWSSLRAVWVSLVVLSSPPPPPPPAAPAPPHHKVRRLLRRRGSVV
jgi:ankyrin repeat protein